MLAEILIVVIASFVSVVLALSVYVRNYKSQANQAFLLLSMCLVMWMVSSLLTDVAGSTSARLFFDRFSFMSGLLIVISILSLARSFPVVKRFSKLDTIFSITAVLTGLLCFTNLVVKGVQPTSTGITNTLPGSFYALFLAVFVVIFLKAGWVFYAQFKGADPVGRNQLKIMFTGLALGLAWGTITNAILPVIDPALKATQFGPFAAIILVSLTAYAIIRHKLFDIRLVVARAMGYLLSVSSLVLLYGLFVFDVANRFIFKGTQVTSSQQVVYTLLAIVVAFTFPTLKKFFDRMTNQVFYRDAYDPQQLLDGLNKTLVSTIELDSLLYWVSEILGQTLKADFCMMGVKEVGNSPQRIIGTEPKKFKGVDIHVVRQLTPSLNRKTIITDELEEKYAKLRTILRQYDIAMLVRLTESPHQKSEGLGYIIMGNKKSGNPYSAQDVQILEIIADELVIAVQNALRFEEIQNFNLTLQQKVTDATKQLRASNEKLKQLDETKDDFISMASHQLRTPLTSVKGYVSMVLDGDAGKITAQQRKLLDQSFISSQRMVYLIADLLNVSRLKTGKFVIENHPTNLAEVVKTELEQLVETAKGRGLTLKYDQPKDFPTLNLDETKIRQVIMNFVDNAIYYTPSGGTITVSVVDKPTVVELTVVDNGIGVPKSEQHHLFTKFYRAGNAKKARPDGTGLGLFMAKKVIVAQGGSLIFTSQEGKGSTFGFTLPKAKLAVHKTHK